MIHEFHICEFAHLLKSLCNPQISLVTPSWSFSDVHRVVKNQSHPPHEFPAEVKEGHALLLDSTHTINKGPFRSLFSATFFAFLCFFWRFHCLKWPPSIALKCCPMLPSTRRLWCVLRGKCVLDKLHSDKSHRAVNSASLNQQHIETHIKPALHTVTVEGVTTCTGSPQPQSLISSLYIAHCKPQLQGDLSWVSNSILTFFFLFGHAMQRAGS